MKRDLLISKKVIIEGILAGKFVSEGDDVKIIYKNRKTPFRGKIELIKRGIITVSFHIRTDKYPPGYNNGKNDKNEANDEDITTMDEEYLFNQKEVNNDDDDDNDDEFNEEEDEEEENINESESYLSFSMIILTLST